MHPFIVKDIEIFAKDIPGAEGIVIANPAFGGGNLDELYITDLVGSSISRIKGVPRGQMLYHQLQVYGIKAFKTDFPAFCF